MKLLTLILITLMYGCSTNPIDTVIDAEAKFINGYCRVIGDDQEKVRVYHDIKLRGAGAIGIVRIICD